MSKEFYIDRISQMISGISNLEWLAKIYSFVSVFADDKEGLHEQY